MGIRTRIFFITLSCLFVGISLSFIVAERDLSIKLQAQIETELSRQAKILRKSISGLIDSGDLVALKAEADEYAYASDSRITIILKNGDVIVDSDIEASRINDLDNHSDRPEIISAFNNGYGSSKRFSSTVKKEMFYFALLDKTNKKHLSFDSHNSISLNGEAEVLVSKAKSELTLIHPKDHNFYESCRNKLGWSSSPIKE